MKEILEKRKLSLENPVPPTLFFLTTLESTSRRLEYCQSLFLGPEKDPGKTYNGKRRILLLVSVADTWPLVSTLFVMQILRFDTMDVVLFILVDGMT